MNLQGLMLPILMFGALGLMMFFGMRKQKRQVAAQQQMQNSLQPGARVMTTSGLHATVTAVADDTIELEIAPGVHTSWVRAAVREVIVAAPGGELEEDTVDEENTSASDGGSSLSLDKPSKDVG
ncbi:preprotein translocase subunit YajC [Nakamurella alba]|uniref:preprotein translocase subunit YajC n=1 Tax=Nakamurella alba TaxID=2665158 RepID=UPI001E335AD8|nr:preprotein translocase subunit YajC [Nakamurella alba]